MQGSERRAADERKRLQRAHCLAPKSATKSANTGGGGGGGGGGGWRSGPIQSREPCKRINKSFKHDDSLHLICRLA